MIIDLKLQQLKNIIDDAIINKLLLNDILITLANLFVCQKELKSFLLSNNFFECGDEKKCYLKDNIVYKVININALMEYNIKRYYFLWNNINWLKSLIYEQYYANKIFKDTYNCNFKYCFYNNKTNNYYLVFSQPYFKHIKDHDIQFNNKINIFLKKYSFIQLNRFKFFIQNKINKKLFYFFIKKNVSNIYYNSKYNCCIFDINNRNYTIVNNNQYFLYDLNLIFLNKDFYDTK